MIEYKNKDNELKEIDLSLDSPFDDFVEDLKNIGIIECAIKKDVDAHQNDEEILAILKKIMTKSKTYKEELDKLSKIFDKS